MFAFSVEVIDDPGTHSSMGSLCVSRDEKTILGFMPSPPPHTYLPKALAIDQAD